LCKKITFSIIIPTFNSLDTIERSVSSVLNQTFKNFEILIIDDGSDIKTKKKQNKIFAKNDKIRLFSNSKNYGVSKSRNFAINRARGEFIVFLDSDDYFISTYLENIYKIIKNKDTQLIIAPNKKINKKHSDTKLYKEQFTKNKLSFFCWNYVLKKSFILKEKIFFKNIKVFEDQLFVLKIFEKVKKYSFYKKKFIVRTQSFKSLGRLTNHHSCYAYALITKEIAHLIHKTRDPNFIKYLKRKLIDAINFFGLFSLICNSKRIQQYSILLSNTNLFKKKPKSKNLNLIIRLFKNKNLEQLNSTLKKNNLKNKTINIYSLSLSSRILIELLKIKKIKIDKIFDNNELFHGKIYKNTRILDKPNVKDIKNRSLILPMKFKKFFLEKKIFKRNRKKFIFFKFYNLSNFVFR